MWDNLANDYGRLPSSEELNAQLFTQKKKKIMIIDDDLDMRLAVCELLVDEGFSVMTAKDGEVGLNQLIYNRDLPDLIVLDLMMPVKSGLEFRREQLKLDEINKIPVVFLTGQGYIDGEPCILKPFDERDFLATIREHLA